MLTMAAEEGKSMAVGILIQSKADVNLPLKDGSTAFYDQVDFVYSAIRR